jgi:hypothetical protein
MIITCMQQRAGLLFLAKKQRRIFLILQEGNWTLPTFPKNNSIIEDSKYLLQQYSTGKLLPIELYLSKDKGFEYGTYVCLVENEFLSEEDKSFCWADLDYLPKNLHNGLKSTLNNHIIRTKIDTILELEK